MKKPANTVPAIPAEELQIAIQHPFLCAFINASQKKGHAPVVRIKQYRSSIEDRFGLVLQQATNKTLPLATVSESGYFKVHNCDWANFSKKIHRTFSAFEKIIQQNTAPTP